MTSPLRTSSETETSWYGTEVGGLDFDGEEEEEEEEWEKVREIRKRRPRASIRVVVARRVRGRGVVVGGIVGRRRAAVWIDVREGWGKGSWLVIDVSSRYSPHPSRSNCCDERRCRGRCLGMKRA